MNSKYYTPSIEELHIGFECEINIEIKGEKWDPVKIINRNALDNIFDYLNHKQIRVKYLDREDIESFGFEKSYSPSYVTDEMIELYTKGNEEDWYNLEYEGDYIVITKCHVYNDITGNWDQDCIFKGVIKNKSELKKVLQMIGIEND